MKEIIEEWFDLWVPEIKHRDIDYTLFFPKARKIISLIGCRRVGKTYIIFQLIDHLHEKGIDKKNLIYINFEDERIPRRTETLTDLLPTLIKYYGDRDYYLFLDELHVMPDWDLWLRRVFDKYRNIKLFISGSSSKMSVNELPGTLRGRTISHEIFPLDFKEYLSFKGIESDSIHSERNRAILSGHLREFLIHGGFPEITTEDDERRRKLIAQDYFRTIITLDIADRHDLRNISNIQDYMKMLLGTTTYSTNKMVKTFRSLGRKMGKETILDYSRYVEETFFGFFISIFSFKIKDRLQYPRNFYVIDPSFLTYVLIRHSDDLGRYQENAVALKLIREFGVDNISYWKNGRGCEVDFIVKEGASVHKIIQVCHDAGDSKTRDREIKALLKASDELSCDVLLLVTGEEETNHIIDGKQVISIPLLDFLITSDKDPVQNTIS